MKYVENDGDDTITVVLAKPTTLSLVDGVDGLPLENAEIVPQDEAPQLGWDEEKQAYTFAVSMPDYGNTYEYTVTASGYEPATVTVTVDTEDVSGVNALAATVKQGETEITDGVIRLSRPIRQILAVDADGEPLEGARFELRDGQDNTVDQWVSGAAPYEAKFIRPGNAYTLLVAGNPDGYCISEPTLHISVDADGVVDYNGTVREDDGVLLVEFAETRIGISTFDYDKPVAGAHVQILRVDNGVETFVADFPSMPAALFIDGLPTNRLYVLRMVEAPAGYSPVEDIYFVIGGDGEISSAEEYDPVNTDEDNVILVELPVNMVQIMSSTPLATFEITYEKNGETALFGTFDTGLYGAHQITGFVSGVEYTISFLEVPGVPVKPEPFTFMLAADGSLQAEGIEGLVLIREEDNCIFFVTLEPNIDTDGDGKPDINVDTNGDSRPDVNIDTDGDGKADLNVDTDGDGKADVNVDTDGDFKPDINIDTDGDGKADINIDTDGDGKADINIDADGDGKADTNIDADGDGKLDTSTPNTGDTGNLLLWTVLAFLSGSCLLGTNIYEKKRKFF